MLQSSVQLIENHVSTARRKDISQNSTTPELTLNLHSTMYLDMNDLEPEAYYPEQSHSFDFEQDSFNTIYFGKNLKGPQGNSNVLFDEIDGLECILTDLHIQGASNPRDCRLVSIKYQGPVLKCRFKVHSGAASNLLPYNVFHSFQECLTVSQRTVLIRECALLPTNQTVWFLHVKSELQW